jgi:hypothetical protein
MGSPRPRPSLAPVPLSAAKSLNGNLPLRNPGPGRLEPMVPIPVFPQPPKGDPPGGLGSKAKLKSSLVTRTNTNANVKGKQHDHHQLCLSGMEI